MNTTSPLLHLQMRYETQERGVKASFERHGVKILFLLMALWLTPLSAQVDDLSYMADSAGGEVPADETNLEKVTDSPVLSEDNDPIEPFNRIIFGFNEIIERVIVNPIALAYSIALPESMRESLDNLLRNLNEPIVFVNNLLQGDVEGARMTLGRFLVNSTVGIGGALDLSDNIGLPYKKQDFGLTLATWGMDAGPYIVIPILGPSNVRDSVGRIGDYAFDPINWWAYFTNNAPYSYGRTALQILAARVGNLSILGRLEEDSLDYYATTRTWYNERREALRRRNVPEAQAEALESPTPEDDEEEEIDEEAEVDNDSGIKKEIAAEKSSK